MKRHCSSALGACLLSAALWLAPGAAVRGAERPPDGRAIVVFAAASLTNALQELGDAYRKSSGTPVKFSFAGSSTLARQIEGGAPADLFFSADLAWMDYLQSRQLILPDSRHEVLRNQLVLIAPADSKISLRIEPSFALAAALGDGHLATGDPDSVPAGRYARAALTSLGVWSSVEGRIVRAESVRAALAFVDRGEAPLGIVYKTDALIDPGVRIVDEFPKDTHGPITYPIALIRGSKSAAARFEDYLRSSAADAVYVKYGFVPIH